MISKIAYFSSATNNTQRFVSKIVEFSQESYPRLYKDGVKVDVPPIEAFKIPVSMSADSLIIQEPFVLITPTYGGTMPYDRKAKKMIPIQVQKFLGFDENRKNIRGVIGTGNINFGEDYARAANLISKKLNIPVLYKAELMGNSEDIEKIAMGLLDFE